MNKNSIAVSTYEKIADIYSKHYFDDLSDTPQLDEFLKLLPDGGHILDVGCGPGQFTRYMMDKGFKLTGIDYSHAMIDIAKRQVPEGEFIHMDMTSLDFDNKSFDGMLVAYSLIHIPTPDIPDTLRGFYRVLKDGGYIEVVVQQGEPDTIIDEPFLPTEKMFFNFFTEERITTLLKDAGFHIEQTMSKVPQDAESMTDKILFTIARK